MALLSAPAPAAFAVDGGVEIQNSTQHGLAGEQEYDTSTLRETIFLTHRMPLTRRLSLEGDFRWLRDLSESGFSGLNQETDRRSNEGAMRLNYVTRPLSLGTRAYWYSSDYSGLETAAPPRDRREYQGWLKTRPSERTLIWADLLRSIGTDHNPVLGDNETRETSGFVNLQQDVARVGQFRYKLSGRSSDAVDRAIRERQIAHRLEYLGTGRFAEGRGDVSVRARSNFYNQTVETGTAGETRYVELPISGGVVLDDTPENLDPLEDDPTPVPELFDQDRVTPTIINLGDSAEPVREVGGDFRNIQYDFGDSVEFVSATLFVDRRLVLPELYAWSVYVTHDPEGRDWTLLSPAEATVTYREWGNGLQGWEVSLTAGVTGRYFKLVELKFGPTVPDLFVTELEVYSQQVEEVRETEFRSEDHRFDGDISYNLSSKLNVSYQATIRERISVGDGRDLSERDHGIRSRWASGAYTVFGQFRVNRIEKDDQRNTDVNQYYLSAGRGIGSDFSTLVSWDRTEDRSRGLNRDTDSYSAVADWKAAPRLRLNQRLSYSRESAPDGDLGSESMVLTTTMRGSPYANLTIDIDRSDRWVSSEGGSGFRAFNDTGLFVSWSPVPLISLSSQVRYQRRENADWYVRNLASWTPLRTRRFEFQFSGNTFYDSRTEAHETGMSASTRWRPRNRLLVNGTVGWQSLDAAGVESRPLTTSIHMIWTF